MSPNERQLRAALHAGEGEPLDADAVLGRARTARRQRRSTLGAVAGAVAAVLAVGVGAGLVAANGNDDLVTDAGPATSSRPYATSGPPDLSKRAETAPSFTGKSLPGPIPPVVIGTGVAPATCPAQAPRLATPSDAGANGPLFPGGVTAIRVCVYQPESAAGAPDTSGVTASYLVVGADAQGLAQAFNNLAPTQFACTADLGPWVAMFGATATGQTAPVVGNLGGCGTTTNGTAVRQARDLLIQLASSGPPQSAAPSKLTASPAPS
ncbi:MAG: hypothetical protein ABJB98_05765 [Actinomycetota bacterium]